MKRNQLLKISGVIIFAALIGIIFRMQSITGKPNEIKFIFELYKLGKGSTPSENIKLDIIEPILKSSVNSNDNKLVFTSIKLSNGEEHIIPILGMNYIRYNFMGDYLYSFQDRNVDEKSYFNQFLTETKSNKYLENIYLNTSGKSLPKSMDEIDGKTSFVINPNHNDQKKIWGNVVSLREHLNDEISKGNYPENTNLIQVYFDLDGVLIVELENPEESKDTIERISKVVPVITIVEGEEIINNVKIDSDMHLTWNGAKEEIKIKISIDEKNSILKDVKKNDPISLTKEEKTMLIQNDSKLNPIEIKYLDPKTKKYKVVNVPTGPDGVIHCYDIY